MANRTKKTILRVKRKFSDIEQPVDTIVLSRRLPLKRQRTVEWSDLTAAFNDSFSIHDNNRKQQQADLLDADHTHNSHKVKSIPNFFDFDFEKEVKKQSVFRLMKSERVAIGHCSQQETEQTSKSKLPRQNGIHAVIHHEDIDADTDTLSPSTKIKANARKNSNIHFVRDNHSNHASKLELLKQKLLHKQSISRGTKIASKSQLRTHQNALQVKRSSHAQQRTLARAFDVVKDSFDVIDIEYDAQQKRYVEPSQRPVHALAAMKEEDAADYDFYELDEEADAEQVMRALRCMQSHKDDDEDADVDVDEEKRNEDGATGCGNDLALEWKLESIKNKHLKKLCKQSEIARLIELEQCAIDRYFENVHDDIDPDDMEKEDENYRDNEYPDEEEEDAYGAGCDEYAQFDDDDDDYNVCGGLDPYGYGHAEQYDDCEAEHNYLRNNTLDLEYNV